MSASIVQVASSAECVRSESTVTDQQVRDGRNEVLALSKGMSSMSEPVADVVGEMQSLDQASRRSKTARRKWREQVPSSKLRSRR